MPDPMHQCFLRLFSLEGTLLVEVPIDQGFSDGYQSRFNTPSQTEFSSEAVMWMWMGGKFKPITFSLNLVAGMWIGKIDTADDVELLVRKLMACCLPTKLQTNHAAIILTVGTWFKRPGHLESVDVTWKGPYDINTGKPFCAEVRFQFITDLMSKDVVVDRTKLPLRETFLRDGFQFAG